MLSRDVSDAPVADEGREGDRAEKADVPSTVLYAAYAPGSQNIFCTKPLRGRDLILPRDYFARFHTISSVRPADVQGFVNFISSAVMDVTIRR